MDHAASTGAKAHRLGVCREVVDANLGERAEDAKRWMVRAKSGLELLEGMEPGDQFDGLVEVLGRVVEAPVEIEQGTVGRQLLRRREIRIRPAHVDQVAILRPQE